MPDPAAWLKHIFAEAQLFGKAKGMVSSPKSIWEGVTESACQLTMYVRYRTLLLVDMLHSYPDYPVTVSRTQRVGVLHVIL